MKKKIGISFSETNFNNYLQWFKEQEEADLEIVELSFEKDNIKDLEDYSGLVLTGGIDIDPSFYGNKAGYPHAPKDYSTERDKFEMEAFKMAQKINIPVLAICRGLQLVNVACEGTLVQDLGDEALNKIHKGGPDKNHAVNIVDDSLLKNITHLSSGHVNSAHHQAIDKLGKGLMINCSAADGTIEGIEWADKKNRSFMLAVQWHPERMENKDKNELSRNIKERFITEVKKTSSINNENN
jgi:putative glutamine amidotransferase